MMLIRLLRQVDALHEDTHLEPLANPPGVAKATPPLLYWDSGRQFYTYVRWFWQPRKAIFWEVNHQTKGNCFVGRSEEEHRWFCVNLID